MLDLILPQLNSIMENWIRLKWNDSNFGLIVDVNLII